jgi:hypothetical protein
MAAKMLDELPFAIGAIYDFFSPILAPHNTHLAPDLNIMFTPASDFLLETPWRIIIPNPDVNSHSL